MFGTAALIPTAARAGFGLAYLTEQQVRADLETGQLVRVLADWCPPFAGYHLYDPSRRQPTHAFNLFGRRASSFWIEPGQDSLVLANFPGPLPGPWHGDHRPPAPGRDKVRTAPHPRNLAWSSVQSKSVMTLRASIASFQGHVQPSGHVYELGFRFRLAPANNPGEQSS